MNSNFMRHFYYSISHDPGLETNSGEENMIVLLPFFQSKAQGKER